MPRRCGKSQEGCAREHHSAPDKRVFSAYTDGIRQQHIIPGELMHKAPASSLPHPDATFDLELLLTGFSHDGRCVARREGAPVVFVRGGLPGQRVLARVARQPEGNGKRMLEADLVRVLAPVPDDMGGERPAPCPHAEDCGGCPWQALPYPGQLVWKERLLADALTRIGRLRLPPQVFRPIIASPAEWGFRNKMEFAFAPGADGLPRLGLRRRNSREVVESEGCLLASSRMMRAFNALRATVARSGLPAWDGQNGLLRHAVLREAGGALLAEVITAPAGERDAAVLREMGERLLASGAMDGFAHSVRRAKTDVAYGESTPFRTGRTTLTETLELPHTPGGHLAPLLLRLGHASFFQVNTAAAAKLYGEAMRLALDALEGTNSHGAPWKAGESRLPSCWDVYSGVGGLALTMAPYFERVLGLESVAPAVKLARENAKAFPQARFECADAARLGEYFRRFGAPDLLVCDPPRAGMEEKTTQAILRARPGHLVLVSCNPATLARDLARLAGGDAAAYEILAVRPVDMFPQTPHVECVVSLRAKTISR